MAKRKIEWSNEAIDSFKRILDFYIERNDSKTYSLKLKREIIKSIQILRDHPFMGKPTDHAEVRVLPSSPFLIFYRLDSVIIKIVLIWDGRRNPEELSKLIAN